MSRLRLSLALAGFAAALLAVLLDDRLLGWVGIALLVSALVDRLIRSRRDGV